MAILCRCQDHGPHGSDHDYSHVAEPIGYPQTSLICGNGHCQEPALVYMTPEDVFAFNFGERVFKFPTFELKVRITDKPPRHL